MYNIEVINKKGFQIVFEQNSLLESLDFLEYFKEGLESLEVEKIIIKPKEEYEN